MDTLTLGLLGTIFLFVFCIIQMIYLVWVEGHFTEKRNVKRRLLFISAGGKHGEEKLNLYRQRVLKDVGVIEKFLLALPRLTFLDRMLLRANMPLSASAFVFGSLALGLLGLLVGSQFMPTLASSLLFGLLMLCLPSLYLRILEHRALQRFEEQLPEALDLLARAVRSGHAISAGMEMVADEMQNPIRNEFAATVDEINLGLSLKEALDNLATRVPSRDLRFFVVALLIQKETGGNIAEVFDNISRLIRERHQFSRQVQALTAEGRLSGWVLSALPIVMFAYIYMVNYNYISLLWSDKLGLIMIGLAIVLQITGMLIIRRIVKIEI